jgi:hypothetical protein
MFKKKGNSNFCLLEKKENGEYKLPEKYCRNMMVTLDDQNYFCPMGCLSEGTIFQNVYFHLYWCHADAVLDQWCISKKVLVRCLNEARVQYNHM